MIYLDNAATGGFKPHSVIDTATNVIKYLSANPGRSGHRLSLTGLDIVYNSRKIIADYFNCSLDRVIFTKNCTEALNTAIFGMIKKGDHVITTYLEHNSALRPLYSLQKDGYITLDIVYFDNVENAPNSILEKINSNTSLVVTTAVSNVTGQRLPIKEIGEVLSNRGIKYVVDGAQIGGHEHVDIKENKISALALAGHKGLYGIMGIGLLVLADDVCVKPLIYGGTGSDSFSTFQPESYPEHLESGTINLPAVASIMEGVKYCRQNEQTFSKILLSFTSKVITDLSNHQCIKIYSSPNPYGIVSFSINNLDSQTLADILSQKYDIAVRGGLHCAPLVHKHLKTEDCGLLRVSIAVQNTTHELNTFYRAICEIIRENNL